MAYRLRYSVNIDWVPDGVGPMEVASSTTIQFSQTSPVAFVPGGDAPTQGNFNTALSGSSSTPTAPSLASDIATQIAAQLARIQSFATGGS